MVMFAVWMDNAGAFEPMRLMSLWSTQATARAEITRLRRTVYIHDSPSRPQRFWLSPVEIDVPQDRGYTGADGDVFPPFCDS